MKYLLLVLGAMITVSGFSQDKHFSQALLSPLAINPANTGAFKGDQRAAINYRDQWRSVTTPFVTYALAFDSKILQKKIDNGTLAAGGYIVKDQAGDVSMNTTSLDLYVSYRIKLSDKQSLSAGIQGGMSQRSMDVNAAQWDSQYDGTGFNSSYASNENMGSEAFWHGDYATGIRWDFKTGNSTLSSKDAFKATLGVATFHLNQPYLDFYSVSSEELYMRSVVHGSFSYGIKNSDIFIEPDGFVFFKGPSREITAGTMVRYVLKEESKYTGLVKGASFAVGAHYRVEDAVIVSALVNHGSFTLGVAYDINVSELSAASSGVGGFEISLRYRTPNPFLINTSKRSF